MIQYTKTKLGKLKSKFKLFSGWQKAGEVGFTLVEVLIAMIILSTGILALTMMLKQSVGSTDFGRRVTLAENAAMKTVEELKLAGYDSIPVYGLAPSAGSPHTFAQQVYDYGDARNPSPDYRTEIDCEVISGWSTDTTQGFLKKLTVTVRWRSQGSIGQGGAITLATFVSK